MTTLEYFKSLATQLRQRKLSESQVADVLRELQSHLQDTSSRPADSFGRSERLRSAISRRAFDFPRIQSGLPRCGRRTGDPARRETAQQFGLRPDLLGLPGTVTYYAATLLVTFALIAWSSTLQRQLPDDMATELRQQQVNGRNPARRPRGMKRSGTTFTGE